MGFYVRPSEAASYERSEDNQRKDLHRFMDHDGSNRRYDNSLSEQNPKLTVCILVPVVWIGILCPIVGGSLLFVVSWFHISFHIFCQFPFLNLGSVLYTYRPAPLGSFSCRKVFVPSKVLFPHTHTRFFGGYPFNLNVCI